MPNIKSALPAFSRAEQALWPLLESESGEVRNDAARNLVSLEKAWLHAFFAENPPRQVTPATASVPVPATSRTEKLLLAAVGSGRVTEPSVLKWANKISPGIAP